jgi:predicted nucleic acid-binding protein
MRMAEPPRRVYWDSCAWIGLINSEPDKIHPLRSIWEGAQRGKFELWTSAYVYLEVIKGAAAYGDPYPPEESDRIIEDMLRQPYVKLARLDTLTAKLARSLKRSLHSKGLSKRSDAIHLATALYWNVEEMHTWDGKHLLQFDGTLTTRTGNLLRIRIPGVEDLDSPLFGMAFESDTADTDDLDLSPDTDR